MIESGAVPGPAMCHRQPGTGGQEGLSSAEHASGSRGPDHQGAAGRRRPAGPGRPAGLRHGDAAAARAGDPGLEVYMLRRKQSMPFAPGAYVFPGGSVDARDADADVAWSGPDVTEWARWLGSTPALASGLLCAAVRETFEESGVLLAGASPDDAAAAAGETRGRTGWPCWTVRCRWPACSRGAGSCSGPTCSSPGPGGSRRSWRPPLRHQVLRGRAARTASGPGRSATRPMSSPGCGRPRARRRGPR